jgi:galactokinase/mevalonate kinase-like predicted kinase
MRIIRTSAAARAGLIGNPSDGYHGKTISVSIPRFRAQVVLYDWPDLEIVWSQEDRSRFGSVRELVEDVHLHGYYGGVRLVKATIRRFVDYCDSRQIELHAGNFAVRYQTNIPRQVGLAGSSAIIVATLRALIGFYGAEIPLRVQPSLALSVEREELGISAGLQDRVIQVYEGLVYMDFARDRMEVVGGLPCGVYEPLDPALLPPLYVAFSTRLSEPTEATHKPLSERYHSGDPAVLAAMDRFADLTVQARQALIDRDAGRLSQLMDENFNTRRQICDLAPGHIEMVETARSVGASAKFAGSGGAIVGVYHGEPMFESLQQALNRIGCQTVRLGQSTTVPRK